MTAPKLIKVPLSIAATGEIIAAVTAKRIRILDIVVISSDTGTVLFKFGSTAVTGAMSVVAGSGFSSGYNPQGHFEGAAEENFNAVITGTPQLSGWIVYSLEGP